MTIDPLNFLAKAYSEALLRGSFDLELATEQEAVTLRLQFYNLLKKCRRLDARHRKDKKDPDPLIAQLLSDADGVIMALPKDAPATLRFCRPEHSPTAGVFMEAIKRSPSGMELIARLEGEKAELEARLNAAEEAIRASEARVLGAMKSHGELPEGKINSAAKSRIAKYLREEE